MASQNKNNSEKSNKDSKSQGQTKTGSEGNKSKDEFSSGGLSAGKSRDNKRSRSGDMSSQADIAKAALAQKQGANGNGAAMATQRVPLTSADQPGKPKPTVSQMLGEMTWVLSQSPGHKHFSIGDLEWMIMPAILLEQFRVFYGDTTPLGFALWAQLSEEAEVRFLEQVESGRGARLRPDDWKSGDRLWLVELVAPFASQDNQIGEIMIADFAKNAIPGKHFKFHTLNPKTGKREIRSLKAPQND